MLPHCVHLERHPVLLEQLGQLRVLPVGVSQQTRDRILFSIGAATNPVTYTASFPRVAAWRPVESRRERVHGVTSVERR
jgi:hypothetical protein